MQTPLLQGGGHGPHRGLGGKREFPSTWDDDTTIRHTMDVARHPSGAVELPSGDFRAYGQRDGVQMRVLVARLHDLLDALVLAAELEPWASLDELMASLRALAPDEQQTADLAELARLAGLET